MEEMRAKVRKYALQNAVKYGQLPKADAVLKRLLAEEPELRRDVKVLSTLVNEEVKSIESMSKEERAEELAVIAPELLDELAAAAAAAEPKRAETGLPELPQADGEKVVMRFAPNPNGAATLGSARGIIINSEYARRYNGTFILRFDDTDPVVKRPLLEAYNWYLEDCTWLDAEPDEVVVASERVDLYYNYVKELIEKEAAYVCFCPADTFKQYKEHKLPCPHRTASVEETVEHWEKMLNGVYEEREAVLRIKTDLASPDPALRDWVAFRVLKRDHPRVGKRYVVWPMLDFESAIEDHLLGITHILRGKDLMKSEKRQRFLYEYFGWEYPRTMLWGKIKIHEFGKFSTSELRRRIEEGEYEGWDDPQLPTLRALRRRGFQPDAIRKFFISMGVTRNDIAVSMKNLYAENRKLIDDVSNRYFFVRNPVALRLEGVDSLVAHALKHPSRGGYREIETDNTVYLSDTDFARLAPGQKLRLKYLCTVEVESTEPLVAKVVDKATEPTTEMPVIQWAPTDGINVRVKRPDGMIDGGIGEPLIATELWNVVQFERYGFVRIDSVNELKTEVVAYFTH
jgi:glutamyl-tRNA synthetase